MNIETPVVFSDGTTVFKELASKYLTHSEGLFILAPSGSGKSHYVNAQKEKNWIDGDYLWPLCGADVTGDEWGYDFSVVMETNNRCDVITEQAKKLGFWVIGSSNHWLRPDAIVLPHWSTHKKYIKMREHTVYDGGAKEEDVQAVLQHRKWIRTWKNKGVPSFDSIEKATSFLEPAG